MEKELDLYAIWRVVKKRWKFFVLIPIIVTLISAVYTLFMVTPQYETSTTMMVMRRIEVDEVQYDDIRVSRQLAETYREIVRSRSVLEIAIANEALPYTSGQLREKVDVESVQDTEIFVITARDPDPQMVAKIVTGVAEAFQSQATEIMDMENISVIDPAMEPTSPVSPRVELNLAVALVVGIMAAFGLAFLLEYLDRSIREPEEITSLLGLEVLCVVPKREEKQID